MTIREILKMGDERLLRVAPPVLDFDTHSVVAIHYSGQYGVENSAVPLWLVQAEPFFAENGIVFAS